MDRSILRIWLPSLCGIFLVASLRLECTKHGLTVQRLSATHAQNSNPAAVSPFHRNPEDTPLWAVPFQQEFWKRKRPSTSHSTPSTGTPAENIDIQSIVERVSHSIRPDSASRGGKAEAHSYTAIFEENGFRLSLHVPPERVRSASPVKASKSGSQVITAHALPRPDTTSAILIYTLSINCGGQNLYSRETTKIAWSYLGNTAQTLLNRDLGLIQHHEVHADGVATTWILNNRPAGRDPLILSVRIEGLQFSGETEQGFHFADESGMSRVRLGKTHVVDSSGRDWDLQTTIAPATIGAVFKITIDDNILNAAAYPLAIDPLVSPEFGMDTPVAVPANENQYYAAVAWNGTNLFVAWDDRRFVWESMYGTRVSTSGLVLDPTGILITGRSGSSFGITSSGSDFFVVWEQDGAAGFERDIYGTRISNEGVVLDSPAIPIAVGPNESLDPRVASNGSDYLVVWGDSGPKPFIYGARVSRAGVVYNSLIPICQGTNAVVGPAVASNGRDFLVAWADGRNLKDPNDGNFDIYAARVTAQGLVIDPNGFEICTELEPQGAPSVGADGSDYMVAWKHGLQGLYATEVTSAGRVAHPDGVLLVPGEYVSGPSIASFGTNYIVAWSLPEGIFATIFTHDVSLMKTLAVSSAGQLKTSATVASQGDGAFLIWSDARGSTGNDVYGAFILSSGEVNNPNGTLISSAAQKQESPSISRLGTNFFVVWSDYRKNSVADSDIYAVRITPAGTVLDPNGIPISTYAGTKTCPAVACSSNLCLVTWQNECTLWIGASTDIHAARVTADGIVLDTDDLLVTTNADSSSQPSVAGNSAGFLVVWADNRVPTNSLDVYGARVSTGGSILDNAGILISSAPFSQSSPCVAADQNGFLVAWTDARSGGNSDIYGARVDNAGHVAAKDIPISTAPNHQGSPAICSDGTNFFVVWIDNRFLRYDIYGTRIASDGRLSDANELPICTEAHAHTFPSVESYEDGYYVAWKDARNHHTFPDPLLDVYGTFVNKNGVSMDTNGFMIKTTSNEGRAPGLSYGGAGRMLVVSQNILDGAFRTTAAFVLPAAVSQSVELNEDSSRAVFLRGIHFTRDPLGFEILDQPLYGTLSGIPPELTYTPVQDFFGSDLFTFQVSDQFTSRVATVSVAVRPVNDAPAFVKGDDQVVLEDSGRHTVSNWVTSIRAGPPNETNQFVSFRVTNDHHSLFLEQPAISMKGTLTFRPATNANGVAIVTVTLLDNFGDLNGGQFASPSQVFTISVTPVNDPPIALPQSLSTDEDTSLLIVVEAFDVDRDPLSYVVTTPRHGSLRGTPPILEYQPVTNYFGPDSFEFKASDGQAESQLATIRIVVNPVNDHPVAVCANRIVFVTNNCTAEAHVDAGSYDPEGDPIQIVESPPGPYPPGTTRVTLTVFDVYGSSDTCTATISVVETVPPEITCPVDALAEFENEKGARYLFAPSATDSCSVPQTECFPASGSIFPIGTNFVMCIATDPSGNEARCTFKVLISGAYGVKQNVLAELEDLQSGRISLLDPQDEDADYLGNSIKHLANSLKLDFWVDQTHLLRSRGRRVFEEEKNAIINLLHLLEDGSDQVGPTVLHHFVNRLVRCDRLLAFVALQDAIAGGAGQQKIAQATIELTAGDEATSDGRYAAAIEHYRNSWNDAAIPTFTRVQRLATGIVRLDVVPNGTLTQIVDASTNLIDWLPIGIRMGDPDSLFSIDDLAAINLNARFYRVRSPDATAP